MNEVKTLKMFWMFDPDTFHSVCDPVQLGPIRSGSARSGSEPICFQFFSKLSVVKGNWISGQILGSSVRSVPLLFVSKQEVTSLTLNYVFPQCRTGRAAPRPQCKYKLQLYDHG